MLSATACPVDSVTDLLGAAGALGALVLGASCPQPIRPTITTPTIIASQYPRLLIAISLEKVACPLFCLSRKSSLSPFYSPVQLLAEDFPTTAVEQFEVEFQPGWARLAMRL